MVSRLLLLLCALTLSALPTQAATGIVVRLVTGGEPVDGPVIAVLTNKDGTEHQAPLADDGEPPDVNPGDHHYSGSTMLDGNSFSVAISFGSEVEDVGEVSWPEEVTARDLVITRYDGIVTLETGAGDNAQPNGQPASGAPGADTSGGASPGLGGPQTPGAANARAPAVSFASSDTPGQITEDSTLYVIGGVLLLVLAGVAFFWFRPADSTNESSRYTGSGPAHILPEPGILGEGSPSLSDGPSVWVIDPSDTDDFLTLLLSSMAAHHRVLVVSPSPETLPLVHGGPVYRMKNPRPSHVSDALSSLRTEPGHGFCILIRATEMNESTINDYCELLPSDTGTAIIVSEAYEGPEQQVQVSREASGWMLKTSSNKVRLIINEWGLSTTVMPSEQA